jgi:hypothetical protein
VRWWSADSVEKADKQGTPVQFRGGPAAVTEREGSTNLCGPLPRIGRGEKAGSVRAREPEDLPARYLRPVARDSGREPSRLVGIRFRPSVLFALPLEVARYTCIWLCGVGHAANCTLQI